MTKEKVTHIKSGVKIRMDVNGNKDAVVAKITNSGNGFICKFPSFSSVIQTHYVCLDYDQAECLRLALNALHKKERK